jgi:hypothetical protein
MVNKSLKGVYNGDLSVGVALRGAMDVNLLAACVAIGAGIVVAGLWIVVIRQMRAY